MKPLRPFFSYYGGKFTLAPRYGAPRHQHIIEPFAGSAGYTVRHNGAPEVTLIDTNEKVVATWRYLIATSAEEIQRLPLLKVGQKVTDLPICQEAQWLIGWWLNKANAAPRVTLSKWGRSGYQSYQFWGPEIRARLARQVDRIRHWNVIHGNWYDAPDTEATWFIDPPYNNPVGRRYPNWQVDYTTLADWCRTRRGQVTVCENGDANWLPFRPLIEQKGTIDPRTGRRRISHELLWTPTETPPCN